ncbi:hypothetical protein FHR84_002135 [Actinopolyspora biskrensis]|uniref:Uncharacterized protein n=1 Tax=Actinopolyspora biskrensis TaxID=1470178 RepID=A0A852YXS3_9ACTN|nr:hypothetical protein [Actinopolyspora biskrensis]NYH78810.1 hypothetical protein [Actinopolyspora biskrensis]
MTPICEQIEQARSDGVEGGRTRQPPTPNPYAAATPKPWDMPTDPVERARLDRETRGQRALAATWRQARRAAIEPAEEKFPGDRQPE